MTSRGPRDQPTRRHVLGWGVFAAVGHLFARRGRPDEAGPPVDPAFILTGGAIESGILVHSMLSPNDVGASVNLAVSRADGSGHTTYAGVRTADQSSIVRHLVTGKKPDTAYVAQLVSGGTRVGEQVRFKTLPALGTSWTRRIAVASCQYNASTPVNTELAWMDIGSWQPDDIWHLGDWGYWGQEIPASASFRRDLDQYVKCLQRQPVMRRAIQGSALDAVTISDHELTANGDPPDGIHNAPETIRELVAFQKLFPIRHYGDTREPRRGRYYSYDIGSAVRVIVTDFRSPDRSNVDELDGPDKTMFGATQLAWIFDMLDASKVNLLINETSWLADPNDLPGGKRTDKPWTYFHEQQIIADHITSGKYRVAWIGGDRHYVGYLRGTDDGSGVYNTLGGFPCYISSGTSKNQLPLQRGELMTWQLGAGPDVERQVCGYMRLTISYDHPTGKVTLHGQGRAVLDTTKPMSTWKIQDIPGGVAIDSWTL